MIVSEIQIDLSTPQLRDQFFEERYTEAFPAVAAFVSHRNGSRHDAKDVFHDALIILYEKVMASTFPEQASVDHYLIGIAKHVWLRKFNTDKRSVSLSEMESEIELPEDYFSITNDHKLLTLLETTGRRCLDLLKNLYYEKLSLGEVAIRLGYGSPHSASVQKFKCLEKLRDTVKEKSIDYADFFE